MDTQKICENCQAPLATDAPRGLCPACLMKVAMTAGTVTGEEKAGFTPPTIEELGPKFPQLEIIELIGRGGMGAVYKARQKELDRIVALKILPPGIGNDAGFAERFAREARALARLNHPGIVTIHDFGKVGPQPGSPSSQPALYYFLMEFVDGVNLRQLLASGRVSSREALAIVPQICDALQFAHDQGIVHRDIKPENILLDRRGRVKVADFGLAKLVGMVETTAPGFVAPPPAATEIGRVMGTPHYMAPEQREHPTEVDHRADIYSLGVVFYQMLTGELPGKPLQAPSKRVQIDVRLDEVVLRAMEQNPDLRYQQASEVRTIVDTIGATSNAGVPPGLPPIQSGKPGPGKHSSTGKVIAIGCGVLALVGIVLIVLVLVFHFGFLRQSERARVASQTAFERERAVQSARFRAVEDANLTFGPVMERTIQARQTGTNMFLDLDTGELLTPPLSVLESLSKTDRSWPASPDQDDRTWEALDIPEDSRPFRYIQWLRDMGADLCLSGPKRVVGFDGMFALAHGNNSTNWESWEGLSPAQVMRDVAVLEWGRKYNEAVRLNRPLPAAPNTARTVDSAMKTDRTVNSAMQLDSTSPGGPVVNLLTLEQSAMWFFKTRGGAMGILQLTGFTDDPQGVNIRYKLIQKAVASKPDSVIPESP